MRVLNNWRFISFRRRNLFWRNSYRLPSELHQFICSGRSNNFGFFCSVFLKFFVNICCILPRIISSKSFIPNEVYAFVKFNNGLSERYIGFSNDRVYKWLGKDVEKFTVHCTERVLNPTSSKDFTFELGDFNKNYSTEEFFCLEFRKIIGLTYKHGIFFPIQDYYEHQKTHGTQTVFSKSLLLSHNLHSNEMDFIENYLNRVEVGFNHGDLAPWNILVSDNGHCHIIDFELASFNKPIFFDLFYFFLIEDLLLFEEISDVNLSRLLTACESVGLFDTRNAFYAALILFCVILGARRGSCMLKYIRIKNFEFI